MRADFRVKFEVEVRGLTALFLYAAYRRHAVSPVSRRGHLRKAPGNIAESAVLPYPLFPCGKRGAEEQAAYEQNARTTWRFRNSYVRLL